MVFEEDVIYCPNCGLEQRLEGVRCVRCGVIILVFKVEHPTLMICPKCDTERLANYCVRCGDALLSESRYRAFKLKRRFVKIVPWTGLGGVVVLCGFFLFSFFQSRRADFSQKPSIDVTRGIDEGETVNNAVEQEAAPSSRESYQEEDQGEFTSSEEISEEETSAKEDKKKQAPLPRRPSRTYTEAEKRQAEDWMNKLLPLLQRKGLITGIDEGEEYIIYVSSQWNTLSDENLIKILDNTAFALEYFGKNSQITVIEDSTGEIKAESGEDGISLY